MNVALSTTAERPSDAVDAAAVAGPVLRRGLHPAPAPRRSLRTPLLRAAMPHLLRHVRGGSLAITDVDGTVLRGGDPEAVLQGVMHVRDASAWQRIARSGNVGLGEGYVRGAWDSPDLPALLEVLARSTRGTGERDGLFSRFQVARRALVRRVPRNDRRRSRQQMGYHYDLGNDLYAAFLDPSMTYSCAVFDPPGIDLEAAQLRKYRDMCEQLDLRSGQRVLEIGCGWGSFAIFAAREYGVHVTALTLSTQQAEWARDAVHAAGLSKQVEIQLLDYRDVVGRFDRIASIEMFEALGEREHQTFFRTVEELLTDDGRACLQVIGFTERDHLRIRDSDGWLRRYIFPGGACPSLGSLTRAMGEAGSLQVHGVREIGHHYAPTLAAWRRRLLQHRLEVTALGYDEEFLRGWELYLAWCEAAFRAGISRTMQIVLVPQLNQELTR